VAALSIQSKLVPVPLRLGADQAVTLRIGEPFPPASVARGRKQTKQVLLRRAPAPVPANQVAVVREMAASSALVVGGTFGLRINLHAHIVADPIVGPTTPAERPAIETFLTTEVLGCRASPAGI